MIQHRRPGNSADGIHSSEWPTVLKRVLEKKESLRNIADDYGVSHETIRRVLFVLLVAAKRAFSWPDPEVGAVAPASQT
jgi:hypothetical protein